MTELTKREVAIGIIGLLIGLLVGSVAFGASPAQAMVAAVADIGTLPEADRPWQRYVWLPSDATREEDAAVVSFAVNTAVSRAQTLVDPVPVAGGMLLRWDLRTLAPAQEAELFALWEKLADEPYFHIKPTGIPTYGAHTDLVQAQLLKGLQRTEAGIVRADWFVAKALTAADGGLYYEFTGQAGKTFAEVLRAAGADLERIRALQADERAALFRSGVTGKPRRIDVFTLGSVRPSAGIGLATVTRDVTDEDLDDAAADPLRNLLKFRSAGGEAIIQRPNGTHLFTLFTGADGPVVEVAPDNIAVDSTGRPHAPGGMRLQAGVSCIRCHTEDGYRPFDNDVQKLLSGGLDVFDDLRGGIDTAAILDRLAGLYGGVLDGSPRSPVQRARDDYAYTVSKITGWAMSRDGEPYAVPRLSAALARMYAAYQYEPVTAVTAIDELGLRAWVGPEQSEQFVLQRLLPPLPVATDGVSPEDPIIGAIKTGIGVSRAQWESVYADAALRVRQALFVKEETE